MADLNEEGDIWADGAEGFFAEFSAATVSSSSRRKLNRLANSDEFGTGVGGSCTPKEWDSDGKSPLECEIERASTVAASRHRLAALVASRASPRELRRVADEVNRKRRKQAVQSQHDHSSSSKDNCDRAMLSTAATDGRTVSESNHGRYGSFGKKKYAKMEEKMRRKSQRAEEARDESRRARKLQRRRR